MNYLNKTALSLGSLLMILLITLPFTSPAQTRYSNGGSAKIVINGTSNIHDWVMESPKGTCTGTFMLDGVGNLTSITGLGFSMQVTSLKSDRGSQMDNNAYKAMASDKYPTMSFTSNAATVAKGANAYTVTAPGKLQISSGTRDVTLVANAVVNADKSVSISGSYKLVTTDYNVKAISIMLGAIKTSANVKIDYSLVMRPQ
jgi:polyisoprenoid-binding protein YceI